MSEILEEGKAICEECGGEFWEDELEDGYCENCMDFLIQCGIDAMNGD